MAYEEYLAQLLRPLGVYDLDEGTFSNAELHGDGVALDGVESELDRIAREMLVLTAQDEGLEAVEALLPYRPVTDQLDRRREALAALLRIGGDSFTLKAINDNIAGCGVAALVSETDVPEYVQVSFPGVRGKPNGYEEMRKIIEEILPCHLGIEYVFWYVTWGELEGVFSFWSEIGSGDYTWEELGNIV